MSELAGVGIATEISTPLYESAAFQLARGDRIAADGAKDARVRELRLRCDHGVGDVMIDGAMLLLLHLHNCAIFE